MTLTLALLTLLAGATICGGLSRGLATRQLGLVAVVACAVAAGIVVSGAAPSGEAAPVVLLILGDAVFSVSPGFAPGERALALALLGGGAAATLAVATAIAPGVRGFGSLFTWALLCLSGALLSLGAPITSFIQPLAWATVALSGYGALWASGAARAAGPAPIGPTLGLLASVLLTGALVTGGPALLRSELPGVPATLCGLLAVLALGGCPPLLAAQSEAEEGPAPLGALIFGLCAPASALGWLLRSTSALPILPSGWATTLGLVGSLGALACAAGALGPRRLRPILSWSAGFQAALVVATAGLAGPLGALAGPALLLNLMLSSVVGATAAVLLERTTGSDDYTLSQSAPRIVGPLWVGGAAAALGLPPLWGFWGRFWQLEAALEQQPWLLAPLLAGSVLLALALAAPLGGLWRRAQPGERAAWGSIVPGGLSLAPLLMLGVAPGLAWQGWLETLRFAPLEPPLDGSLAVIGAGLTLLLLVALVAGGVPARSAPYDPDETPTRLGPEALSATLRPLAGLGRPAALFGGAWATLLRLSGLLRLLIGPFEQRYYLLGVLAALITIMLLMAL